MLKSGKSMEAGLRFEQLCLILTEMGEIQQFGFGHLF
jgi:hypothetical protein